MASYRTVLVGTDGSDTSFKAVDRAAEVARDADATLVIVCAYHPMSDKERVKAAEELGDDDSYKIKGANPAEDVLRDAKQRATDAGASKVETEAAAGDPVETLVEQVSKHSADLIVVGNRGLNSVSGRLLGSVPANVSRQAKVDILIVHTTGGGRRK